MTFVEIDAHPDRLADDSLPRGQRDVVFNGLHGDGNEDGEV